VPGNLGTGTDNLRQPRYDSSRLQAQSETVRDPQAPSIKAKLTIADLEREFDKTEKIRSGLERLFDGTEGPIRFVGGDDYRELLAHSLVGVRREEAVRCCL